MCLGCPEDFTVHGMCQLSLEDIVLWHFGAVVGKTVAALDQKHSLAGLVNPKA